MSSSMKVSIGNTAFPRGDKEGWCKWQMFVKPTDGTAMTIAAVTIRLHPTFKPQLRQLAKQSDGSFRSTRFSGWGTFSVQVTIVCTNDSGAHETYEFEHELDFQNGGAQREVQIPVVASLPTTTRISREALSRELYLQPYDNRFWHGRLLPATANVQKPNVTWKSSLKPRDDHDAPDWLTASEYEDNPGTLDIKIECLAALLRASRKTVVYSGAGISVAAGIHQAARGGKGYKKVKSTTASPTTTHYALVALAQHNLIHGWVQQNHDGLPQKAGFPQERINEIHGSWYDPSNPVVKYSGTLRDYECDWMGDEANTADLAMVLGTSLGGLNSDQVATKTAHRSKQGKALGMVMINLQQTEHDGKATLRIFSPTDTVLLGALTKLGIAAPSSPRPTLRALSGRCFLVPYDEKGRRSPDIKMWWDLRPGAAIQLAPNHHNIQGAQQPSYMHLCKVKQPQGKVVRWRESTNGIDLQIEGVGMLLGQWWVDAALRGGPPVLPIVNTNPRLEVEMGD